MQAKRAVGEQACEEQLAALEEAAAQALAGEQRAAWWAEAEEHTAAEVCQQLQLITLRSGEVCRMGIAHWNGLANQEVQELLASAAEAGAGAAAAEQRAAQAMERERCMGAAQMRKEEERSAAARGFEARETESACLLVEAAKGRTAAVAGAAEQELERLRAGVASEASAAAHSLSSTNREAAVGAGTLLAEVDVEILWAQESREQLAAATEARAHSAQLALAAEDAGRDDRISGEEALAAADAARQVLEARAADMEAAAAAAVQRAQDEQEERIMLLNELHAAAEEAAGELELRAQQACRSTASTEEAWALIQQTMEAEKNSEVHAAIQRLAAAEEDRAQPPQSRSFPRGPRRMLHFRASADPTSCTSRSPSRAPEDDVATQPLAVGSNAAADDFPMSLLSECTT
mmetsp:Transcript_79739/g.252058  ORF Transcript_79739/g.252058 Transcript_79739/m.252058 type:complete len:406 (+) Transcript_79739:49-1266(+)